jgi:hypothetical protein|tara:strand:+ start:32168 stop:32479 length:312 start_codon:yes stop_codon:yes gene_type:complete
MDLEDQSLIQRIAEEHGSDTIVVLGQPDADSAEITAETVHNGDPTWVGPLAGVPLGLPVYHILEDEIKGQIDADMYENEVGLMALTMDKEQIVEGLDRARNGP